MTGYITNTQLPLIQPIITEYHKVRKRCRYSQVNEAEFPTTVTCPCMLVSNVQALVSYLSVCQDLPYGWMTCRLEEICGISLSEGSIKNLLNCMEQGLSPACEMIRERIAASPVVGADETGISIHGHIA